MSDINAAEKRMHEHVDLVSKSFPDISCLRCGSYEFSIMPNVHGPSGLGVVTMACIRCGHIEQHLIGTLREAVREGGVPIPLEKVDHAG